MSLSGIILVFIVSIFIIKQEDLAIIIRTTRYLAKYILDVKKEIASYLNMDTIIQLAEQNRSTGYYVSDANSNIQDEIEFYLQQIIKINGHYEGDYTLQQVKLHYSKLIQLKIQEGFNIQNTSTQEGVDVDRFD